MKGSSKVVFYGNTFRNPLTGRRCSLAGRPFNRAADPAKLEVPNQDIPLNGTPEWYAMQNGNNLTVPNQNVPFGDVMQSTVGFLPGSDSMFRLSDGTLLDFKTRRIIQKPKRANPGEWGECRTITFGDPGYGRFSSGPSFEQLVNHPEQYVNTANPDGTLSEPMDPESAAYWLRAEAEAKKLEQAMTDEQRAALADFEKHFPASRLIEESKKLKGKLI